MSTQARRVLGAVILPLLTAMWCVAQGAGRPPIYDEKADARAMIAQAVQRAKLDNKRVLIQWGGNWCSWCWKLHDAFTDQDIQRRMFDYELVMIDSNSNQALAASMGSKIEGVPFLTVLDADGKKLTDQATDVFEEGDHHVPARVLAFLDKWKAPVPSAEETFNDAKKTAAAEKKMVFVRFSTPSCGWCKRLDAFLQTDLAAQVLAPHFVFAKIDEARMADGSALRNRLGSSIGGVPWFAFADADGAVIVTSDGPDGNIGFPAKPAEIEHFLGMIKKTCPDVTPSQLEHVAEYLRAHGH